MTGMAKNSREPLLRQRLSGGDRTNLFLSTALGLGLSPVAPGTCGTLLGVLLHGLVVAAFPSSWNVYVLGAVLIVTCLASRMTAPWAMKHWKSDDPKPFVLDEVAGYLVIPVLFTEGQLWEVMLWGFLLFRFFDIVKLPPARQVDRSLPGAWGILLDDLVAGVQAVLVMYVLLFLGVIG